VSRGTGRVFLARAAVLAGALAVWEAVAAPLNPLLYVRPSALPGALRNVLMGRELPALSEHVGVTLREIAAAFLLAVVAGLWLGFVLGLRRRVGRVYEPMLAALYAIPSVIWYPSLMLFFGLGPASKIAFGFLLAFFPICLSVLSGIRQVNPHLVTVARSMGARPWTVFRKVMLPSMAGTLVGGLRAGLALSVVGVLVGEMLGARSGLGYLLNYAYGLFMTREYAALVVLVAAGVLVLDGLAGLVEARGRQWSA
jgi:NitT/TauT family transport system permease protein